MEEIINKINKLEEFLTRAEDDIWYSTQVEWTKGKEATISEVKIFISNARTFFKSGRYQQLDLDIQAAGINNYNQKLDTYLNMFPEYRQDYSKRGI